MAWPQITDYDLSSWSGLKGFVIDGTLGVFPLMIMIVVYILFAFFYWVSERDILGSFAVGGFALFVTSFLMWLGGWINGYVFVFAFAVSILSWIGAFIPRNR